MKSYAVPGHRLGAITADEALLSQIEKVLDCMMICPPRAAQTAVAWAVEATRHWREDVRATINGRGALFAAALAFVSGWSISAMGAYFAYVRHPLGLPAEAAAAQLAEEAGIVALPGTFFGLDDGHPRFAVVNVDDERIRAMPGRLDTLSRPR